MTRDGWLWVKAKWADESPHEYGIEAPADVQLFLLLDELWSDRCMRKDWVTVDGAVPAYTIRRSDARATYASTDPLIRRVTLREAGITRDTWWLLTRANTGE